MNERVLLSLWSQHASWAEAASRLRARRRRWRTVVWVLTIGGAALQTLSVALESTGVSRGVGAIGVVALLAVAVLSGRFLTPSDTRRWLRSRSVSEGIKSEIYAYRAGAAPYVGDCALEELRTKVGSIVDWAKDLALEIEIAPVVQPLPPTMSAALYLDHRVGGQIARSYQRAKKSGRRAQVFHWIQILLVIFTATLGAFATLFAPQVASLGSWTAVLTTVVGGLAAYAAGSHYELQATLALATARELQDLVDEWRASGRQAPSPEWSQFVRTCEEVISTESRCWMAKIDQDAFAVASSQAYPSRPGLRAVSGSTAARYRSNQSDWNHRLHVTEQKAIQSSGSETDVRGTLPEDF